MAMNWVGMRAQEVLKQYMETNLDAKLNRTKEYNATVKIQTAFRRHRARQSVRRWHHAGLLIQRIYRGHLGRERFHECRRKRDFELRVKYFNAHAIHIQRMFRGYWSRKYVMDYHARKAFIAACLLAGQRMKTLSTMNHKLRIDNEQKEAQGIVHKEIDKFFAESRHRCGTEAREGAFSSPSVAILGGGRRSPSEEHIGSVRRREEAAGGELHGLPGVPARKQLHPTVPTTSRTLSRRRMSLDTRRRVQEASMLKTNSGTYITRQGPYETRYQHRRKEEAEWHYLVPHEKEFAKFAPRDGPWWVNMGPTFRRAAHYHTREVLHKEAKSKELKDNPNMVENPWNAVVPAGFLFETYVPFDKVFPRRQHHHHWPKYSLRLSKHGHG